MSQKPTIQQEEISFMERFLEWHFMTTNLSLITIAQDCVLLPI